MDENRLISVVVPVYNVRPYLEEALESVLRQRYDRLEIIVIDDGSTDGSGEICDAFAKRDQRVIVVHQENKGLSAARNAGLDRMTGEAVAFLDPDDAYGPSYIDAMWKAMLENGADMVVCKYTVHNSAERLTLKGSEKPEPSIASGRYNRLEALRALADGRINFGVWNKLYRRALWTDARFPEGHVYEDIDVIYRIVDRCKTVYVLDQPLYFHRKRPGSITDTVSYENMRDWERAYTHYARFVRENTPEIFAPEQERRIQVGLLGGMIANYVRGFGREGIDGEDLRARINALGSGTDLRGLPLKARTAYGLLRVCPWLLRAVYPAYHSVRLLVYRIFGR